MTEQYIAEGEWNPLWDQVRSLDPEFIEAYLAFRSVPHRNGPLPPHVKELVLIAVNVATTHLYAPGARRHMRNALALGATAQEILEVIQLTTVLGIHSVNLAVPMLCEELERFEASGQPPAGKLPVRKLHAGKLHAGKLQAAAGRLEAAVDRPQRPSTRKQRAGR